MEIIALAARKVMCMAFNPLILKEFLQKLSSGSMILLTITFKLRIILQTI